PARGHGPRRHCHAGAAGRGKCTGRADPARLPDPRGRDPRPCFFPTCSEHMTRELHADILIVGGGLGGVAAALGALRSGSTVIMSEEFDWLGGQLTSQAVPPDEHSWVEQFGVTRSYRQLRNGIRQYYRD